MGSVMTWGLNTRKVVLSADAGSFKDRMVAVLAPIPAKALARSAESSIKAAEKWKAGDSLPGAEALAKLCADFDEVWAEFRLQACRSEDEAEAILAELTARLRARSAAQ